MRNVVERKTDRKRQEVELCLFLIVGRLGSLSGEQVEHYKQLFLDAIQQYETHVIERDRENKPYLNDARYSLVPTLKERVTSGKEIPSDELRFLSIVLQEYNIHLTKLKGQPWARQDAIDAQLDQFNELVRDDIVKIGKPMIKFGKITRA